MNFTNSPFERMMKESPSGAWWLRPLCRLPPSRRVQRPERALSKKFRTLIVEPRTSGQVGPRTGKREETHIETIQGYEILKTMTFDNGWGLCPRRQ